MDFSWFEIGRCNGTSNMKFVFNTMNRTFLRILNSCHTIRIAASKNTGYDRCSAQHLLSFVCVSFLLLSSTVLLSADICIKSLQVSLHPWPEQFESECDTLTTKRSGSTASISWKSNSNLNFSVSFYLFSCPFDAIQYQSIRLTIYR